MPETAVIYLARAVSGLDPLQRFLQSYQRNPAGIDHDLVVMFKGFRDEASLAGWRSALADFPHKELQMSDFGFDIRAYSIAARQLPHRHLCFLNTFSEPLAPGWLAMLHHRVLEPGVGVVGCTGSWTSIASIVEDQLANSASQPLLQRLLLRIKAPINRQAFAPFPNPHIRSNAFIISRDLMNRVWPRFVTTKRAAYHWESGRAGFTRQVQALGFEALVAGRNGCAYRVKEWSSGGTFLQGKQENLLVSDNQTRGYDKADAATRSQLSRYAWGEDLSQSKAFEKRC